MNGRQIKNMLADIRLVLCNSTNKLQADYHVSARGVPYISVVVGDQKYHLAYFGKGKFFRIFDKNQNYVDIRWRTKVIGYFRSLARKEQENNPCHP